MTRRRTPAARSLAEAVTELIENLGIRKKIQEYDAVLRWAEIVGEQIARVTKATRIVKGVLVVEVKTSVWRNELVIRKEEIISKLNNNLGEAIVTDIKFH